MTHTLKTYLKRADYDHQDIGREKVRKLVKNFLGVSYKKKVNVPIKKTTKAHHRLRNTWILQFLTYSVEWKCQNVISIDETAWRKIMNKDRSWSIIG